MIITITYRVDAELYRADTKYDVSLTTTEYLYRNELLVHLQIGKNFGIRLNNRISYEFNRSFNMPNEQYLFKKTYNKGKAKPITQSTFAEKLKRFDMSQTVVEKEILEEYSYIGKDNAACEAQIEIKEKNSAMTAVIDFTDVEQYANFVVPAWLIQLDE